MPVENTGLNIPSIKKIARERLQGQWRTAFAPAFLITLMTGVPSLFDTVIQSSSWIKLMSDDSWMDMSDPAELYNMVYSVQLSGAPAMLQTLLSLFSFLCGGALAVSMAALALKIIRHEEYSLSDAFSGFVQFGQAFVVSLLIMLFSFLWGMITILPASIVLTVGIGMGSAVMSLLGIIIFVTALVGYVLIILRYSMAYFVASDDRLLPASHVTASSVFLMHRRTGNYFLLELSFIGWIILAAIPLSIGIGMMSLGYLDGAGGLTMAGAVVSAAGMVPLAFVSLYMSTAEAIYYSTISGNYNVSTQPEVPAVFPDSLDDPDPYDPDSPDR